MAPKTLVDRSCEKCGGPFKAWECKIRIGSGKYCSHKCSTDASKVPVEERLWSMVHKTDKCWLWTGSKDKHGYGRISYNRKPILVHRLVLILDGANIVPSDFVCHKCDNPSCVNPDHLFIGSAKDNSQDMKKKGRSCRGERQGQSKLTENIVKDIRSKYAEGKVTQKKLADEHGIHQVTVSEIITRKIWQHI